MGRDALSRADDVTKKILIAEDDLTISGALEARLKRQDYALLFVRKGDELVETFQAEKPDLVVISLTIDGGTGIDACRILRSMPLGALIPVLLLGTGNESIASAQQAIAMGADHFFRKPEQLTDLVSKVENYLGRGQNQDLDLHAHDPITIPPQATQSPNEWSDLDDLLRPDPEIETSFETDFANTNNAPSLLDLMVNSQAETDHDKAQSNAVDSVESETEPITSTATSAGDVKPASLELNRAFSAPRTIAQPTQSDIIFGQPIMLAERGLEQILWPISKMGINGRIEIASGGVLRRIFFDRGRPIYVDSSSESEDLAAHLCSEGVIPATALAQARQYAHSMGVSVDEVLIESNLVTAGEIYDRLKTHITTSLFGLFAIEDGEAVVIKDGPKPLDPIDLGLSMGRLIIDGINRKFGRLRLYQVFGTGRLVPTRKGGAAAGQNNLLTSNEMKILDGCDGRRSVVEIASSMNLNDTDVLAVLYALSVIGFVDAPAIGSGQQLAVNESLQQRALAPRTADQMPGYSDLVASMYQTILSTDYFNVLGVNRGATQAELRVAYEGLTQRFNPHRVGRDSPLWFQVKEIATVLDEAYRLLSNQRLRARYQSAIS
ncbi:MAG: response regulator [Myxococcota bacterium]|nr:response regulator [Myxococcota bacterium]